MLKEYVEDNYCARFDTCSYHRFTEMHLNARHVVYHDKAAEARNLGKGHWVIVHA